ncbi:hypothetical protein Tco_1419131 [Tanacetum coccineum]
MGLISMTGRSLKLVLRVEKKMFVIEQPIPPAPAADSKAQGKPVGAYVFKMKGYVEQLERLGYVLPQYLSIGLILNGLTNDFVGFIRNYNMHNMEKTIGELHALLIENAIRNNTGKGKGKGMERINQVYSPMAINPKPSTKEHSAKDDTCHHCKEAGLAHIARNVLKAATCGRAVEVKEIQDEDTSPSENTSKIPMKVEGFEPPQEEVIPVCRRLVGYSKRGKILMQERLDLNKTKGASTPEEVKRMQRVPYGSAIGSIMYAVRGTRPDVAFAEKFNKRCCLSSRDCSMIDEFETIEMTQNLIKDTSSF